MNPLKYLEKRIRGWLPKTPALPHPQRPVSKNMKTPVKPDLMVIFERKIQRSTGMCLGLGIAAILVGLMGWFFVSDTYRALEKFFLAGGLSLNHYLFRDLIFQMAFYLMLVSYGAFALLFGVLTLRSQKLRRIFYNEGPYRRLGGGLMGGGGSLTLSSIFYLFRYVLTSGYMEPRYVQLQLFFIFFTIGISLVICGIFALSRKNKNVN